MDNKELLYKAHLYNIEAKNNTRLTPLYIKCEEN